MPETKIRVISESRLYDIEGMTGKIKTGAIKLPLSRRGR